MKFDTYSTHARMLPAVISATPLLVLWYFLLREPAWKDLLDFLLSLKFVGTLSLSLIFLHFYAHFIRVTAKHFERKYFSSRGFPTTYFLLYENSSYSSDYKDRFRERARKTLKLRPLDAEGERRQPQEAKNRIAECFDHIRLAVKDGHLVSKHNVSYGFARNLIGGSIFAAPFCILNMLLGWIVFREISLTIVSAFLLLIYLTVFAFRKSIIVQNAESYARQLIAEFMNSQQQANGK